MDVRIVCGKKTGLNKGYGFVNFATTIAHNELLKKGMLDSKKGRKLKFRTAVKKEASKQFLVGENSLSSQKGPATAEYCPPTVNVHCLICCENLFSLSFFPDLNISGNTYNNVLYVHVLFNCA